MLRPAVAAAMRPSTNGVTAAPRMPWPVGVGQGAGEHGVELGGVELGVDGDRHSDEHAGVGAAAIGEHRGDLGGGLDGVRHGQPAGAGVEGREPVVAPPEHGHAGGLEVLQRAGQVEERLGTGAHGDDRVVGDGVEVGRHVAGDVGAAVHARRCRRWRTRRSRRRRPGRPTADTVVAPKSHRWARATARSRSAALRAGPRMRSCSPGSRPTRATPSSTAVTAGTAPAAADGGQAAVEGVTVGRRRQAEVGEDRRLEGDDRLRHPATAAATSGDSTGVIAPILPFCRLLRPDRAGSS